MWRCPKCGSTDLNQYRMPYGAQWCNDCGFRVEDKTAVPNPFYFPEEGEEPHVAPEGSSEEERINAWFRLKKKK